MDSGCRSSELDQQQNLVNESSSSLEQFTNENMSSISGFANPSSMKKSNEQIHTYEGMCGKENALHEDSSHKTSPVFIKTVPKFPIEVVIEIMKWLSAFERNSSRLVCKEWYHACLTYENEEKLCIGYDYCDYFPHFRSVLNTLVKSQRKCFHFEFYKEQFEENVNLTKFWPTCGPKIRSLKLVNCKISSLDFSHMLKYCSNLETFSLYFNDLNEIKEIEVPSLKYYSDSEYLSELSRLLDPFGIEGPRETIPSNLKNLSLRTLEIHFERVNLHRDFEDEVFVNPKFWISPLRFLFDMFPNIVNFSLCHYNLLGDNMNSGAYQQTQKILKYLARDQMESVVLNLLSYSYFRYDSLANLKLTNVTEIAVNLDHEANVSRFVKFAREQLNLRKVTSICAKSIRKENLDSFVTELLKFSSLLEFQIFLTNTMFYWDTNWSTCLSASNVHTLRIFCTDLILANTPNVLYDRNEQLTTLAVRVETSFGPNIVPLLQTFPNLQDLCLSHVDDIILASICTNQVELRSLTLGKVIGEKEITSSLAKRLRKIEKLEIPENVVLKAYHFERLKTLRVVQSISKPPTNLQLNVLHFYANLPLSLEAVWIDKLELRLPILNEDSKFRSNNKSLFNFVIEVVGKLKNLKFLCLERVIIFFNNKVNQGTNNCNLTVQEVSSVFQHCPSLQKFLIPPKCFLKNVISKRVECSHSWGSELMQRYMNVNNEFEFHYRYI